MNAENDLRAHYTHGTLGDTLLAALARAGKDIANLKPADMMGADEFHIGGAQATNDLAAQLGLRPGMRLLDIGCGIGGPARHLAAAHDCHVTGIDLTAEYVAVAADLSRRMGLADRVAFREANAARLDFPDASFDGATLLHVGMNIADKAGMFAAIHRVVRPGGFLAVYDIMRTGEGPIDFPVPWSSAPETSFVESPEAYKAALHAAGFTIAAERSRAEFAVAFFAAMRARMAQSGPPPIGLNIIMGPTAPQKIANMVGMLDRGVIAPVEIIARR